MKTLALERSCLDMCVSEAQRDRVLVTRRGKPVAVVVGMDPEQLRLGRCSKFWRLIAERRGQKTLTRKELTERLDA